MTTKSNTEKNEERRIKRRQALISFFRENEKNLISINRWAKESQVAERTLGQLIDGSRPKNMRSDTYEKLCNGASKLLGKDIYIHELTGENPPLIQIDPRSQRFLSAFEKLPQEVQDSLILQAETTLKALAK
jgi:hypothetical protein